MSRQTDTGVQHMKPILTIKSRFLTYGIAAIFLGTASLTSAADNNDADVQTSGNVNYVSGGVGTESLDQLGSISRQFNLKLVFALKSGEYLSGVQVAITNAKGKSMLDTTSQGPWFMTKLPAGNYQVAATVAGKTEKRQVAVDGTKLKTIDFRWGSE